MGRVTLSFDNGPEPEVTPGVLDCLAAHRVPASFFVLGSKLAGDGGLALAERAHDEGHLVGNHTWSHSVPLGELDDGDGVDEIARTEALIDRLGQRARLFRPFGRGGTIGPHLLSRAVVERLEAGGYTCVLWNSVPGDWRDPDDWMTRALQDCTRQAETLVVLHDLPTGAMRHLDAFIGRLKDAGHELVRDFPLECTPIVDGRVVGPLDAIVGD